MGENIKPKLTHFDSSGQAHMVDVGDKASTRRVAVASGKISMLPTTLALIQSGDAKKGDVLGVARIAAIQASKKTSDLIPLCHPLALTKVNITFDVDEAHTTITCTATAETTGQTGVEMEALTAVSVGLLTIYDMCKAVDRGMTISEVKLLEKHGGKSGDWVAKNKKSLPKIDNISELWYSEDSELWEKALTRYSDFVKNGNEELEQRLNNLDIEWLKKLTPEEWRNFLLDDYFRWKYTAENRYVTTTTHLKKQNLSELAGIRKSILDLDCNNILLGLKTAKKISGLGTAGASGLLSLIYSKHFATVDQFVVKALRNIEPPLREIAELTKMNEESLSLKNGELIINILRRKADDNNKKFAVSNWTPRKIDMILWTFGR